MENIEDISSYINWNEFPDISNAFDFLKFSDGNNFSYILSYINS